MSIASALNGVVAAFRGVSVAGSATLDAYPLRAVSDPADIQTPTVWVPVPDIRFQFHKHRAEVTWTAYLIAPNSPKQNTTTDWLSQMIDAVTGLFPFTTGELYSLNLPGGVTAQAYRLTWESHVTIGE